MKNSASILLGLICSSIVICAQESSEPWEPISFPESRYEAAWERNPFNLDTAPEDGPVDQSFARDFTLAGVSVIGAKKRVLLVNRKTKAYETVYSGDENGNGFSLVSIALNPDRTKVTAVIKKGGREATVKFDPKMTAARAKEVAAKRAAENPVAEKVDPRAAAKAAALRSRGGARVRTPADMNREEMTRDLPGLNRAPDGGAPQSEPALEAGERGEKSDATRNRRLLKSVPRGAK